MGIITYLILLAITGLVVGAFARLALPGRDPMSIPATIGVGLAGSFIAGLIFRLISGGRYAGGGFLASVVVATLIVYLIRRSRGGGLTDPGYGSRPGMFGSRRRF
jgi:uncharacterized membrane protein YeaQ/YmgE (transglycosylase-associated protein family)